MTEVKFHGLMSKVNTVRVKVGKSVHFAIMVAWNMVKNIALNCILCENAPQFFGNAFH